MTPDYIVAHWTEELLELMTEKLVERKKRETRIMKGEEPGGDAKVSDSELFARMGVKVDKKL